MKNQVIICFIIVLFTSSVFAQENPVRIGLKFGIPNVAGLNLEYVTTALNAKLAPTLDLSYFSLESGTIGFSYFELGCNYYFMNQGKGPYGHLSYGRSGYKGLNDYYPAISGKVEGINLLNFRLGAKWGNTFYFRPEIGYETLIGGSTVEVEYIIPPTNTKVTLEEDIPGFFGGVVFNLGFGVAF